MTLSKALTMLVFITFIPISFAYTIKYQSPYINQTQCQEKFDLVAPRYYEGIKKIWVIPSDTRRAYYLTNGLFWLTAPCHLPDIVHELAHHQQWLHRQQIIHDEVLEEYEYMISQGSQRCPQRVPECN